MTMAANHRGQMRVYRFLKATFGIEALRDRRLKITQISELNDPFELLGVDVSKKGLRARFRGLKESLTQQCGLLCFSKKWRNPVLWSHYADRHRGLCLGFDVSDDLLMEVTYTEERLAPDGLLSSNQSVQDTEMKKLLTTKFSHWSYEEEWRCFVSLTDRDPINKHYFYRFSDNLVLREVLVGCESGVSRGELETVLGKSYSQVIRFKTRAAFKRFDIVKNKNESLWK